MKEYIFTKDYKLIGEENLEIEIEEQDSLIKVEFEELETVSMKGTEV